MAHGIEGSEVGQGGSWHEMSIRIEDQEPVQSLQYHTGWCDPAENKLYDHPLVLMKIRTQSPALANTAPFILV